MAALNGKWDANVCVFMHFLYFTLVVRAQRGASEMTDAVAFKNTFFFFRQQISPAHLSINPGFERTLQTHFELHGNAHTVSATVVTVGHAFSLLYKQIEIWKHPWTYFKHLFSSKTKADLPTVAVCVTEPQAINFHWAVSMEISKSSVYHLWYNYNGWIWIFSHFVLW